MPLIPTGWLAPGGEAPIGVLSGGGEALPVFGTSTLSAGTSNQIGMRMPRPGGSRREIPRSPVLRYRVRPIGRRLSKTGLHSSES